MRLLLHAATACSSAETFFSCAEAVNCRAVIYSTQYLSMFLFPFHLHDAVHFISVLQFFLWTLPPIGTWFNVFHLH